MKQPWPSDKRHQAFWSLEKTDRPVVACNVGYLVNYCYPRVMESIPDGPVAPEDIRVDLVLEDLERLYQTHQEVGGDCPFTGSPFNYIPWMEAIMG